MHIYLKLWCDISITSFSESGYVWGTGLWFVDGGMWLVEWYVNAYECGRSYLWTLQPVPDRRGRCAGRVWAWQPTAAGFVYARLPDYCVQDTRLLDSQSPQQHSTAIQERRHSIISSPYRKNNNNAHVCTRICHHHFNSGETECNGQQSQLVLSCCKITITTTTIAIPI